MVRDRVAVIGGGVTGALVSVRLAERGFSVVALEKSSIGNGSSSRSMAGIRAQWAVEETVRGMRYSAWWYARFHDALHTPAPQRQPVLIPNGYLFLYEDPAQAAANARDVVTAAWDAAGRNVTMQRAAGIRVEILTPFEVAAQWPWVDAGRLRGATWGPDDGFLQPHVIYQEAFRRARELGVDVRVGAEVIGSETRGGRITALRLARATGEERLEVNWVVNATNAWAPRVSRSLGGMPLPIQPSKRYLYHVQVEPPVMSEVAWQRMPMVVYGMGPGRGAHTRPDGPLLLLGGAHAREPEPMFEDDDQDSIREGFGHAHGIDNPAWDLLAQVADFAPAFAENAGPRATTCGFYAVTPDSTPLIGPDTELANLVHAAGFSGHGVMHAPVTALLVEALLTGASPTSDAALPEGMGSISLAAFDPARDFSASPKEAFAL
ncbi:MAG TPA: FAD-binding oxidoreductase [Ktedonobacterales bacterium]